MPLTPPVPPDQASPAVQGVYDQIRQSIGQGQVSVGFQMMANVEPYLRDSFENYHRTLYQGAGRLDAKQREAIALAVSSAMNCTACVRSHAKRAVEMGWTGQQVTEILAVVATCTMYNTYYRFKDLSGDGAFEPMKMELRADTMRENTLGREVTELISIVVSNINGCRECVGSHVKKALKLGLTHADIDEAVRLSAMMSSFNAFHRVQ